MVLAAGRAGQNESAQGDEPLRSGTFKFVTSQQALEYAATISYQQPAREAKDCASRQHPVLDYFAGKYFRSERHTNHDTRTAGILLAPSAENPPPPPSFLLFFVDCESLLSAAFTCCLRLILTASGLSVSLDRRISFAQTKPKLLARVV